MALSAEQTSTLFAANVWTTIDDFSCSEKLTRFRGPDTLNELLVSAFDRLIDLFSLV